MTTGDFLNFWNADKTNPGSANEGGYPFIENNILSIRFHSRLQKAASSALARRGAFNPIPYKKRNF